MKIFMLLMLGLLCSCSTNVENSNNKLETKFYSISSGLLESVESKKPEGKDIDFQAYFQDLGLEFPAETKMTFVNKAMRLVVTSTPKGHEKLEEILKDINIEVTQFFIQTKISEKNDQLSAPGVTVLEGKQATIRIIQEQFLASEWQTPTSINKDDKFVNLPLTPTKNTQKEFGVTLETKATEVKLNSVKDTIHIQGKILLSELPIEQNTKFEENDLLKESLQSYSEDVCHYSLFIKDGATRKIKFNSGDKVYTVEFTVSKVDTSKLPQRPHKSGLPDFKRL